jgi:SAM-dependent methyltransferase
VSKADRQHWDSRYSGLGTASLDDHPALPPSAFAHVEHLFPTEGTALELACGRGQAALWLTSRGMDYWGVDVSPVAIAFARNLTSLHGVSERCRFDVVDLDHGLPAGPPVTLLLCHLFRDPRLNGALIDRLAPGGMLALAVLSEVGAGPGEFRARPGELRDAFGRLKTVDEGEKDGIAWLLARRPSSHLET